MNRVRAQRRDRELQKLTANAQRQLLAGLRQTPDSRQYWLPVDEIEALLSWNIKLAD
jgi:hypothetical protein